MTEKDRNERETAQLLILNAMLYGEEKGKDISRYRISMETLRKISCRSTLRDAFLQDVADQLNKFGWSMATLPNGNGFAIFKAEMAEKWAGLSSNRLKDNELLGLGESQLETKFETFTNQTQEADDEVD